MLREPCSGIACLLVGVTLASCGATAHPRTVTRLTTTSASARTAAVRAHKFIPPPANAIVSMRRFSPQSLMWQTIFVRPDGSGLLTTLIGETAGAPHRAFQLSASQLATLRRLIAGARSARPGPGKPAAYFYTLRIPGKAQMGLEGPMPKRLGALVNFLDALTLTYCC